MKYELVMIFSLQNHKKKWSRPPLSDLYALCRICNTDFSFSHVLKTDSITSVGSNLSLLSLECENQLDDENLGVGSDTWVSFS